MKKIFMIMLFTVVTVIGSGQGLNICLANGSDVRVRQSEVEKIVATDKDIPAPDEGGYLFIFMTNAKYGRMHYALSRDCYEWTTLNDGQPIDKSYCGHPDVCRGPDGTYYTISVNPYELWTSKDMVKWDKRPLSRSYLDAAAEDGWQVTFYNGAPKMMYDDASGQFMITWHGDRGDGKTDDWDTMRTLYTLTSDFETFTHPQPLFSFTGKNADMEIIDCIVRKVDGKYYAILKDERSRDKASTGKTIRIAESDALTGPYSDPVGSLTPADKMREAPIIVERPGGGWYLFAESYDAPPLRYELFVADNITGRYKIDRTFKCPAVNDGTDRPNARHGCIVPVDENIYQAIFNAYK